MRNAHHGRARSHHLARLGLNARHHARHIGHQRGVGRLVALRRKLCTRLVQRGLRSLEGGRAPLQLGATDEILVFQCLKALEVGCSQITLRGGRGQLRTRRICRQLVIPGVELRQHLTGLHPLAQLCLALHDLARHPKTQARLHARAHLARIFERGLHRPDPHGQQLDRAHGLFGRR